MINREDGGVDLRELVAAIRAGRLSPREHVQDVLARLAGDRCNAVVYVNDEDALLQADQRAAELAAGGWRGPLHGVAVVVKDIIDVAGVPTRCGSNVLRDAPPAARDAAITKKLREAGAVIVAKTHTHEFAYGPTGDVAAEGPARNPHDPARITGGSSSGSAAAVAAGYVPLGLGTDTGCSVRTPAALCGVVGLKPASGRLPMDGVFPLSETCDHVGLLGADAYAVSVGFEALTTTEPEPPKTEITVGRPTDGYWRAADPAITDAVDRAGDRLSNAGIRVVEVSMPGIDELAATYRPIVGAEAYATHARWLATQPERYQSITAERLLRSKDQPAIDYVEAQRTRRRLATKLRQHLSTTDVLLTPTTPIRATPIGESTVDGMDVRAALLSLTLPFNLTGWPAVSAPVPSPPGGGLPIGVQLVGVRAGADERTLLSLVETLTS
jgi:Asp-tRNA(Asn)/Glu-tRNA(Gln) amidotransferase A subunit family amidase